MTSQVIVVGGGIAGLTAAIHAARGGAAVTLVERVSELEAAAPGEWLDELRRNDVPAVVLDWNVSDQQGLLAALHIDSQACTG